MNQACYALRHNGHGNEFDPFGVIRALQDFAEQGLPVRMLGFPAFLWFALERMRELGLPPLQLHPESLVFLGGGWKPTPTAPSPRPNCIGGWASNWAFRTRAAATATARWSTRCLTWNANTIASTCPATPAR